MIKSCLVDGAGTASIHLIDSFLPFYCFHSLSLSLISPISTVHCFQRYFAYTICSTLIWHSFGCLVVFVVFVNCMRSLLSHFPFFSFFLMMVWVIRAEMSRLLKSNIDSGQSETVCFINELPQGNALLRYDPQQHDYDCLLEIRPDWPFNFLK